MSWKRYVQTLLATALLSALLLYAWILLVDPYDDVWFSPPLVREPVSKNQRFSYPAIARNPRFDSLIVGTSSVRLLSPAELDPLLGASFANLAMDAATPYEQAQMLALFVRHHPRVRYAFLGIDDHAWCDPSRVYKQFTERPFPAWMYDEDKWNDLLYLFNSASVDQAWRQFQNLLGLREPRFGRDGYSVFVPPESAYDLDKVRRGIYGGVSPVVKAAVEPPYQPTADDLAGWVFPNIPGLGEMLAMLPEETTKVLIFPPYHQYRMPVPGTEQDAMYAACKDRVMRTASRFPNTLVMDFMIRSSVTLEDTNYWDPEHYRVGVASLIAESVVGALRNDTADSGLYRILARTGGSVAPGGPAKREVTVLESGVDRGSPANRDVRASAGPPRE